MDVTKLEDGTFICVSNGTPEENEAIDVIAQMLVRLGESEHNFGEVPPNILHTCRLRKAKRMLLARDPQND